VQGEHFCDRREELRRLSTLIQSRNSGWLYAPRRYGKTSLIREAFALAEGGEVATAYVDLWPLQEDADLIRPFMNGISALLGREQGGLEKSLATLRSILESFVPTVTLDDRGRPVFSVAPVGGGRRPAIEELLSLPEQLAQRHRLRVVIALDEFQEVAKIKGLESRLRSVMQHQQRVSYLLAGSQASLLREMFSAPERPFFHFAEHVPIGRIPRGELVRYVHGRFRWSGLDVAEGTAAALVDLAEDHPNFVQQFAAVAWNLLQQGVPEGDELRTQVIAQVVASQDTGFRMIFDRLAASQRRILVEVAQRGGAALLSTARREAGRLGPASTVTSALDRLAEQEILVREREDGTWWYLNPAFRLWVQERAARRAG
jgi:hypothetical protein